MPREYDPEVPISLNYGCPLVRRKTLGAQELDSYQNDARRTRQVRRLFCAG